VLVWCVACCCLLRAEPARSNRTRPVLLGNDLKNNSERLVEFVGRLCARVILQLHITNSQTLQIPIFPSSLSSVDWRKKYNRLYFYLFVCILDNAYRGNIIISFIFLYTIFFIFSNYLQFNLYFISVLRGSIFTKRKISPLVLLIFWKTTLKV
jgi:hypothetical protein